jgi:hypothetical protein
MPDFIKTSLQIGASLRPNKRTKRENILTKFCEISRLCSSSVDSAVRICDVLTLGDGRSFRRQKLVDEGFLFE